MLISSRCRDGPRGLVARSVADHGPQDVDATARECQQCLLMSLPFGTLARVVRLRGWTALQAGERGRVHRVEQASVEAVWPAEVAADGAGVACLAVAQPRLDASDAAATDRRRGLVARQQDDGPPVGQVQRPSNAGNLSSN